jgi:hypothetical protein
MKQKSTRKNDLSREEKNWCSVEYKMAGFRVWALKCVSNSEKIDNILMNIQIPPLEWVFYDSTYLFREFLNSSFRKSTQIPFCDNLSIQLRYESEFHLLLEENTKPKSFNEGYSKGGWNCPTFKDLCLKELWISNKSSSLCSVGFYELLFYLSFDLVQRTISGCFSDIESVF